MDGKNPITSKTFWSGLIITLISVFGVLEGSEFIAQYPQVVAGIGVAIGVLTIALRFLTGEPLVAFGRSFFKPKKRDRLNYD